MQDIRRQFLETSVQTLKHLNKVLQTDDEVSEQLVRQFYRQIHTIKGTAQTFSLTNPAKLAHELENILSNQGKIEKTGENNRKILIEGLDILISALENADFEIPQSFIEKIQETKSDSAAVKGVYLSLIPPEVFDQLTEFEKNKIATALMDNKNLYRLDAAFDIETFSDGLRNLQDLLKEKGEIIITMPLDAPDLQNKIGF